MKTLLKTITFAALCLIAVDANAQVTANSFSSGGTASATASGRGNTRLTANAVAVNGGTAISRMYGSGHNGGFATGNSNAFANGGIAISNGQSYANGWGARSHVRSDANAYRGFAQSNGTAVANGFWSNAKANSQANAFGNRSVSSSRAVDNRMPYIISPQPYFQN